MNLQQIPPSTGKINFNFISSDATLIKKNLYRPTNLVLPPITSEKESNSPLYEKVGSPIFLSKESPFEKIQKAYKELKQGFISMNAEDLQNFVLRGGKIDILGDSPLTIDKGSYFTGCSAGVNRSQASRAYLKSKGCTVDGVFSGAVLADDSLSFVNCNMWERSFETIFKCKKLEQIGADVEKKDRLSYFQALFERIPPTTFICFAECSISIIKLLIDSKEKNLTGFRIIHIPWGDEIQEPSNGVPKGSLKAHQAFREKLEKYLKVQ